MLLMFSDVAGFCIVRRLLLKGLALGAALLLFFLKVFYFKIPYKRETFLGHGETMHFQPIQPFYVQ